MVTFYISGSMVVPFVFPSADLAHGFDRAMLGATFPIETVRAVATALGGREDESSESMMRAQDLAYDLQKEEEYAQDMRDMYAED